MPRAQHHVPRSLAKNSKRLSRAQYCELSFRLDFHDYCLRLLATRIHLRHATLIRFRHVNHHEIDLLTHRENHRQAQSLATRQ